VRLGLDDEEVTEAGDRLDDEVMSAGDGRS
jgi:hypothetical protein